MGLVDFAASDGNTKMFKFEHSKDYQKVQFLFLDAVESLNHQNIVVSLVPQIFARIMIIMVFTLNSAGSVVFGKQLCSIVRVTNRAIKPGLKIRQIHGSKLLLLSLRAGSKTIFVVANLWGFERPRSKTPLHPKEINYWSKTVGVDSK